MTGIINKQEANLQRYRFIQKISKLFIVSVD